MIDEVIREEGQEPQTTGDGAGGRDGGRSEAGPPTAEPPAAGPPVAAPPAPAAAGAGPPGLLTVTEDLYRLLVSNIRDYGIFMLDTTGRVASWNVGAQRIKGYRADQIIGRHFSQFYPDDDRASRKPDMELELAARDGRFEDEGWRVRADGTRFWASVIITALRDESGRLVGYAKVTRDLTERRLAEELRLADARRVADADAANRAKSEFLAAMSHELRTPLNAIAGYADLLAAGIGGSVTPQQAGYLQRIQSSQEHLLTLINDILNFARIEGGRVHYDLQPMSLCRTIDTAMPMIEPLAAVKSIVVERLSSDDTVAVADPVRVEQILLNLLSNAVKFTPIGGHITLSCATEGGRAVLRVRDSGQGIPEERLESIFEPFVQVGRTFANPHEGTGLGLAISRDLARAMGGDVTVRSEPGVGSSFTVQLPLLP